jgi:hypothetical protein
VTLEESLKDADLTLKPIGTVRSIYRLCVGTPRQGVSAIDFFHDHALCRRTRPVNDETVAGGLTLLRS